LCAELINESFLRQSAFSEVDRYCSAERQIAMMKMITLFIKFSENAIDMGTSIKTISRLPVMRRLMRMGEEIGEGELEKFDELRTELDIVFTQLTHKATQDTRQETASNES
jgi:V/A-type H+-transporting ATPase subunit A